MSMAPDYIVEVRDVNFTRLGQIAPEFLDIKFVEVFRGVGAWELKLPAEHPRLPDLKTKGAGIIITHTPSGHVFSGRMQSAILSQDATDPVGTWKISGVDDNIMGAAVTVLPDPAHTADAQTAGYWNAGGNGETVMKSAVSLNAGAGAITSRKYPWLTTATNLNRGSNVSTSVRFKPLGDVLTALGMAAGLGWRFAQSGASIVFDVFAPADKTALVQLDIRNGGLTSTELGFSAPTATEVLALGQGQGADRTVRRVTSPAADAEAAAWGLRWETVKDQRNTDDPTELQQAGEAILTEAGSTVHSLKVTPSDAPNQRLGVDWGLGDQVTVVIDGTPASAIVAEIATSISSAGVIRTATVGDPVGFDWEAKVSSRIREQDTRLSSLEALVDSGIDWSTIANKPATFAPDPTAVAAQIAAATTTFHGVVSANWDGYGLPTVTLDSSAVISARLSYDARPGQAVLLAKVGATYWITGPDYSVLTTPIADKIPLMNGWRWYHDIQFVGSSLNDLYSPPLAYRSSNGFVQAHGLLHASVTGVVAANTVIANLPRLYRPLQRKRFLQYASQGFVGIIVETNGDIKLESALTANQLVSLSGIKFNNDPALTRTPMTLLAPWVAMGGIEGTPQYAIDSIGRVLVEGSIKGGQSTSDVWLTPAAAVYSGGGALFHSWEQASGQRFARWDNPTGPATSPYRLHSQVPSTGNVTSTGRSLDFDYTKNGAGVFNALSMQNGWVNYGMGWNTGSYAALADGTVQLHGLVSAGTPAMRISFVPQALAPKYRLLIHVDTADASGRVDISPLGEIIHVTGSNGFVSLETLTWVPQQYTP